MKTITFYPNQVHFNNQLNDVILTEVKNIYPQLLPFIGKQILLSDGKKSKKFNINFVRKLPEPLKNGYSHNHVCYLDISNYSIWLKVSLCFSGGKYEDHTYYCTYIDKSVYIGKIEQCILTELRPLEETIKDCKLNVTIDIEEEKQKVNKYNTLISELDQLQRSFLIEHKV